MSTSVVGMLLAAIVSLAPASPLPPAAPPVTRVFLARHAERYASVKGSDPTVTPAGARRAAALGQMLRSARLAAVFCTQFERTRATAESISVATGAPFEVVHSDSSAALARTIRTRCRGQSIAIIGHGDSLPNVVAELGWEGDEAVKPWRYDDLCLLELRDGEPTQLVHLHYGGPADTTGMAR